MMHIGISWKERHMVFMRNKDIVHVAPITGSKQKQVEKSVRGALKEVLRDGEPFIIMYQVDKEICRHLQSLTDLKPHMVGVELQKVPRRRFMNGLWRLSKELVMDSFNARLQANTVRLNDFADVVNKKCPMSAALASWPHKELLGGRK